MRGLILKDFINLKKNLKMWGAIMLVYAFMAFTSKDASFFSSVFTMLFAILILNVYSCDELAKWDIYALTMPVSRKNIVQSKYLMMLLLTLISTTISVAFTVVLNSFIKSASLFSGIDGCIIGASIVLLFYSVTIPFITKLGVEKARLIFFAVYIIPFVIIYFIVKAVKNGIMAIPDSLLRIADIAVKYIYFILPAAILIALGISYVISVNIYRKKEF